jgi:hypothetical protein
MAPSGCQAPDFRTVQRLRGVGQTGHVGGAGRPAGLAARVPLRCSPVVLFAALLLLSVIPSPSLVCPQ